MSELSRYYVEEHDGSFTLWDRAILPIVMGSQPDKVGAPIYQSTNERKMLDDCDKLNKAWKVMQERNR